MMETLSSLYGFSVKGYIMKTYNPNIDQNKKFIKMVRINLMLNDKGG